MLELLMMTICLTLLFGFVYFLLLQNIFGVPYVPSARKAMRAALAEIELDDKKFLDLGSGDGLVVISAAMLGANATGVEINPVLVWVSRLRSLIARPTGQTRFRTGSYTTFPIGEYDVIYLYVLPKAMVKLLPRLQSELKPGAIVVTNTFKFESIAPEKTISEKFHVYRF